MLTITHHYTSLWWLLHSISLLADSVPAAWCSQMPPLHKLLLQVVTDCHKNLVRIARIIAKIAATCQFLPALTASEMCQMIGKNSIVAKSWRSKSPPTAANCTPACRPQHRGIYSFEPQHCSVWDRKPLEMWQKSDTSTNEQHTLP